MDALVYCLLALPRVRSFQMEGRQVSLLACLKLLEKLNEVNKRTRKIPFDMFYVNELAEMVDIRQDYVRYVLKKVMF